MLRREQGEAEIQSKTHLEEKKQLNFSFYLIPISGFPFLLNPTNISVSYSFFLFAVILV